MNRKIRQKFVLVKDENFSKLNELLDIEEFHSHISVCQSRCYVLFNKEMYE